MTDTSATVPTSLDWVREFAHPSVLASLEKAEISRQHAQLLVVLSSERQEKTLQAILQLQSLPAVQQLAKSIEAKALRLDEMPFSTSATDSQCSNCIHNSTLHPKYFDQHIAPGHCTNSACAQNLWEKFADGIRDTMPSKYRVIRIEPVLTGSQISGNTDSVGEEQFKDCSSQCENYGASIIGGPNNGLQQCVDVCFDSTCLSAKLEAMRDEQLQSTKEQLWRKGLQRFMFESDRGLNRVLMLCMLAGGWKVSTNFSTTVFGADLDPAQAFKKASNEISPQALTDGLHEIAVDLVSNAPLHQVRDLIVSLDVPLAKYFPMSKDFLKRLTSEQIAEIANELGIEDTEELMTARMIGGAAYAKAMAQAIPDQALQGYFPPVLRP
jgi:hypothetical protein